MIPKTKCRVLFPNKSKVNRKSTSSTYSLSSRLNLGCIVDNGTQTDNSMVMSRVAGKAEYKHVITWISDFDGSIDQYRIFVDNCNEGFKAIKPDSYKSLLCYVMSRLDIRKFPFMFRRDFTCWEELKETLDEHFGIRLSERKLFKEIILLEMHTDETLFAFHWRLLSKFREYKEVISSLTKEDQESRVRIVNGYLVESFISAVGQNLRVLLRSKKPASVGEAFDKLKELEIEHGMRSSHVQEAQMEKLLKFLEDPSVRSCMVSGNGEPVGVSDAPRRQLKIKKKVQCQICNRKGHSAIKCRRLQSEDCFSNGSGYDSQEDHCDQPQFGQYPMFNGWNNQFPIDDGSDNGQENY